MSHLIPRVSSTQMPSELAEYFRPRVDRLGYLGEFFQCAAHQPKALLSFMAFTEELRGALGENLSEVIALTVSCVMNNAYERVQHERRSLNNGFGEAWVRAVTSLGASSGKLTEEERLVQQLAIVVISRKGHDTKDELEAVIGAIGHEKAIAVLMSIGRYVTHALVVNALDLAPPLASPIQEEQ